MGIELKVEKIEELALTIDDDRQIADLLKRSFDTDFGDRSYFVQPHQRRYIIRDATIVGHIGISARLVRMGSRLITTLCVGDVATDPGFRGRGIASTLLNSVLNDAQSGMWNFVLLFGDAKLYAANGFQASQNPLRYVDTDGHETNEIVDQNGSELMFLQIGSVVWDGSSLVDILGFKF